MRPETHLVVALLLALIAQPGSTASYPQGRGGDGHQGGITAEQAAERVRRQTGGRVLDVREVRGGFRVKVLTPKGEVRSVRVGDKR